jgi:hypothetical protein
MRANHAVFFDPIFNQYIIRRANLGNPSPGRSYGDSAPSHTGFLEGGWSSPNSLWPPIFEPALSANFRDFRPI